MQKPYQFFLTLKVVIAKLLKMLWKEKKSFMKNV